MKLSYTPLANHIFVFLSQVYGASFCLCMGSLEIVVVVLACWFLEGIVDNVTLDLFPSCLGDSYMYSGVS